MREGSGVMLVIAVGRGPVAAGVKTSNSVSNGIFW